MRFVTALILLALVPLAGCNRTLDVHEVRAFIDLADETARRRYAPEICELRGENFRLHLKFQGANRRLPPTDAEMSRSLYCREAAKFARLRHYELERKSMAITLAPDRKTASVDAEYLEKLPYYDPDRIPGSPFDFREVQILATRDRSVIGIEGGDLRFLSTDSDTVQALVDRKSIPELAVD